jgi:ABC-2 type transport system ATP-binding protein
LLFSDEMTVLVERFREVEITFDAAPELPAKLPASWMRASSSAAVVQFIESRFDPQRTNAEIRNLLGEPRDVTFTPMSLRSIFLALARSGRDAA